MIYQLAAASISNFLSIAEKMTDCTLSSGDKSMKAHQIILATHSSWFKASSFEFHNAIAISIVLFVLVSFSIEPFFDQH